MASNVKFRIVALTVIFTTLLGVYSMRVWNIYPARFDFGIYYTAACLVRSDMSVHIYDEAEQNTNLQFTSADPNSVFVKTAHAHGISQTNYIFRYLYPPTLADLVTPLSLLSFNSAWIVWCVLGGLMGVGLGVVLTRTLDMKFFGSTVLVAAGVLLFRPTLHTVEFGQVSIFLAFLLAFGFSLYVYGRKNIAALVFALAIAIKLEPIVVIIPLIAWRDWKCIRNLAIWGVLLFLGVWAVNGSNTLNLYFLHELPAMSAGDLGGTAALDVNRSLGNIVSYFNYVRGGHPSAELAWLFRAVSALILIYAGWLSRLKPGKNLTKSRQFEIGIVFLLLACCLAPSSWYYNWTLCAPVMVMFCKRAWEGRMDTVETVLLISLLLSLTTSKFDMVMVTPILGTILGIIALHRMRLERRPQESYEPINQLKTVRATL